MPLIKLIPHECREVKHLDQPEVGDPSEPEVVDLPCARAAAESAIHEFQATSFDLPYEEARKVYARLLVGRGFDRVS